MVEPLAHEKRRVKLPFQWMYFDGMNAVPDWEKLRDANEPLNKKMLESDL